MAMIISRGPENHLKVCNNIKTVRAPSMGFEWEVPVKPPEDSREDIWEIHFEMCNEARYTAPVEGFTSHVECGGVEYTSAVSNTLGVAKWLARKLEKVVKTHADLFDYEGNVRSEFSCCGIHVHISPLDSMVKEVNLWGLINHPRAEAFLPVFCQKENNTEYSFLSHPSTGCDTEFRNQQHRIKRDGLEFWTSKDTPINYNGVTYEFRCFGDAEDLIQPALEFVHSLWMFTDKWRKVRVPTLEDYFKWLDKQNKYHLLKEYPPFVEGKENYLA